MECCLSFYYFPLQILSLLFSLKLIERYRDRNGEDDWVEHWESLKNTVCRWQSDFKKKLIFDIGVAWIGETHLEEGKEYSIIMF